MSNYKPELAEGFSHTMEGWIIFVIDLLLLMAAHRLVNLIYNGIHGKSTPADPAV
jgi:hypothetical protein